MNVVLIGYRGSGKSTVGKMLAEAQGCGFVDTDELIAHLAGCNIAVIFEREGEGGFREREAAAIKLATSKANRVISVGGGAVESAENGKLLRAYGTVVWLEAPVEVLWQRIQVDPATDVSRPDLAGGGLEEVRRVLARRVPLYAETSHVVVRVGSRTPREVVSDIEAWLAANE